MDRIFNPLGFGSGILPWNSFWFDEWPSSLWCRSLREATCRPKEGDPLEWMRQKAIMEDLVDNVVLWSWHSTCFRRLFLKLRWHLVDLPPNKLGGSPAHRLHVKDYECPLGRACSVEVSGLYMAVREPRNKLQRVGCCAYSSGAMTMIIRMDESIYIYIYIYRTSPTQFQYWLTGIEWHAQTDIGFAMCSFFMLKGYGCFAGNWRLGAVWHDRSTSGAWAVLEAGSGDRYAVCTFIKGVIETESFQEDKQDTKR